jgi:NAD(P) transhydrogenase subunit beta
MNLQLIHLAYFVSSILFILGLRSLGHPQQARRGMLLAALGMFIAVVGTLLHRDIVSYHWIGIGIVLGTLIGIPMGLWIPMTKMPERIALSHSFGGLAVALVGVSEYYRHGGHLDTFAMAALGFEVLLGAITFTGSLMAFGKLQGILPGRPLTFRFQNAANFVLLAGALGIVGFLVATTLGVDGSAPFGLVALGGGTLFYAMLGIAFLLGILLVLPIGGADMPVVICLLNSYAGLAAAASGFALTNNVLIICGALDGGSGFLLAMMMSKAMNRSFGNVLFGAFGSDGSAPALAGGAAVAAPVNEGTIEDATDVLKAASSIIVVPGYGMAVSQAQHAVRDLAGILQGRGASVKYAIHPVAGRMPGHMNVLLAEADVPYDQLFDLDDINNDLAQTDVALVIGANDVVNPAARDKPGSAIYGMPVLHADQARTVMVLKRSMNPGFAGIENELFVRPNTMMVLGDAKKTLVALANALKE